MVSGGADSACAAAAAGPRARRRVACTRCTSTTGFATTPTPTRRPPGASARRCGSTSTSSGRSACAEGNLQAAARDGPLRGRRAAARAHRRRLDRTGHTRTDLAETVLYRLAASPGRRALLGLSPRSGRVVRPLLGLERERDPRARGRRRAAVRRRPDQRRPDVRPQPDPRRGAAGAARDRTRAPSANIAETQRRARRGGASCSSGSCSRRSPTAGAGAGDVAIRRRRRSPAATRRSGGWRCARSPSAPPAAQVAARARARGRDRAARRRARGRRGRARRRAARRVCERGHVRFAPASEAAGAGGGRPGRPGRLPASATGRCGPSSQPGPVEPAGPDLATLDAGALGGEARGPGLARRRPDAAARAGRHEDAPGPVHRPQGAAVAARTRCRSSPSDGRIAWVAGRRGLASEFAARARRTDRGRACSRARAATRRAQAVT